MCAIWQPWGLSRGLRHTVGKRGEAIGNALTLQYRTINLNYIADGGTT